MKKKIIIGSILIVLLMLCMPMISNVQAEEKYKNQNTNDEPPSRKIFLKATIFLDGRIGNRVLKLNNGKYLFILPDFVDYVSISPKIGDEVDLYPGIEYGILILSFEGNVEQSDEAIDIIGTGTVIILDF